MTSIFGKLIILKKLSMKKYLMTSVAAIAFCGLFTSCTHEIGFEAQAQKSVIETYQKAFVTAFGQPDPENEWGFGESKAASSRAVTRAKSDYADYKGSMQPVEWYQENGQWKTRPYTFPSDAASSNFLANVPSGVKSYAEVSGYGQSGYAKGTSYLDPSWKGDVNIWGSNNSGGTLYIKGNNDFSSRSFYVSPNTNVYLLEGATLKLRDDAASTIKFNLYMAPTAKLIAKGTTGRVKLDNTAKLYNHGDIECKSFEVNNTSLFYNCGTLTTSGEVFVANRQSVLVNDGTITSGTPERKTGRLVTAGSGRVQNNAEWTVYGETIINSNANIWVNNGHFTTENYTYTATSSSVINNCFLTVHENFCINIADSRGSFKIDSGGGVLTKNFYGGGDFVAKDNNGNNVTFQGGPFKVEMGSKALFKVTETAMMNALGSGIEENGYGFHGVGSDYAVLQAKNIVQTKEGHGNVAYGGKLYVSAETHFPQGYSGAYPYIHYQNGCSKNNIYAAGFNSGKPKITIPTTPCNPGFGDTPPDVSDPDVIRVICEDLSVTQNSDFDFNDVVFDVKLIENNSKVRITLRAAGGTLPLTVAGEEVHALFKEVNPNLGITTMSMINTENTGDKYTFIGCVPATFVVNNIWGSSVKEVAKNIPVLVYKLIGEEKVWVELECEKGKATAKVAVQDDYSWCDERTHINNKYTLEDMRGNEYPGFTMFVRGIVDADEWYRYRGPITDEMVREYTGQ